MLNNKLKAAAKLAAINLKLIPVYGIKDGICTCYKEAQCTSAGKHPIQANWQNNSVSAEDLTTMLTKNPDLNVGVITGGELLVVDIDPKNDGLESFKEIEELFEPTFKVITGSGGYHFYYRLPDDYNKPVGNRTNIVKGIDLRADGGFVVAPGSLHKSGNFYTIAEDSLDEIQIIGEELLELITQEKSSEIPVQNNSELIDCFGEGERNSEMTSLIGTLFRRRLSIEKVLEVALSLNDTICTPPLKEKEVATIVKSVAKYKNHENISAEDKSAKEKVRDILYRTKGNNNLKSQKIADLIVQDSSQRGKFYKTLGALFYFDDETKRLISINKENIRYKGFLAYYGINASMPIFKFVHEAIIVYVEENATFTEVFKYAHYESKKNAAYIKNAEGMCKITPDDVSYCDNGTDGVLFSDIINAEPFKFIEDLDEKDYIGENIISLCKYNDSYISAETQKLLVHGYFISLFMPEFLETKPIIVAVGTKGSAKTTLLKVFIKCLYGIKHSVVLMPNKLEDLDVIVANSHFVAVDNLDTYKEGLNDKLAVYATGGFIKKRKLYTDAEMYECYIDAFLGITTRTLGFKRDDVLQRLILIFLESIKTGYKAESELIKPIMDNRDRILSQAIKTVQKILQIIGSGKYKNFKSNLRLADFSKFMTIFLDNHDKAEEHLAELAEVQRSITMENDILIPYLAKYVNDFCGTKPHYVSASHIYQRLEGYSKLGVENTLFRNEFTQAYQNVMSFAKRLNNIKDDISEYIAIETKRGAGNQTIYLLNKGKKFDELPQKKIASII